MSTSGVTRPPRTRPPTRSPTPEEPRVSTLPASRIREARSRRSYESILAWSLGVSLAFHLLILLFSPLWLRVGPPPGEAPLDRDRFARTEIQLIEPVASASAPEVPEPQPLDRLPLSPSATQPPRPAAVPRPGGTAAPEAAVPPAGAAGAESASERLRPGARDPRLWVNPRDPAAQRQQSDLERYREHLQARIDALNDSMAIAARENRRTRDWTFKDSQGRRWGIGEGGSVELGGIRIPPGVLPVPAATGDNQSLEGQREIERQREEIRRQEEARERRRQPSGNQ
jgi:hypothetical protein